MSVISYNVWVLEAIVIPLIIYSLPEKCLFGEDVVLGCTADNVIYINERLDAWGRQYVLYHELCHWLGERNEDICTQVATNLSI